MRLPTDQEMKTLSLYWQRLVVGIGWLGAISTIPKGDYGFWETAILVVVFTLMVEIADWGVREIISPAADLLADWCIPPLVHFFFHVLFVTPLAILFVCGKLAAVPARLVGSGEANRSGAAALTAHKKSFRYSIVEASTKPCAFAKKHGAYGLHPLTQSLLLY